MKQKLYNLIITIILKTYLILKYLFVKINLFFLKLRISCAKNNWYLSKNRNYYNPTLASTVFKYGDHWRIARYGSYFGIFENKKDAMNSILQIWLEENGLTAKVENLKEKLQEIKQKIFDIKQYNENKNKNNLSFDIQTNFSKKEIIAEDVNFIAEYFYLAQTRTSCYRCSKDILVNAIILPEGFKTIDHDAIEDLEIQGVSVEKNIPFCHQDYLSILSYITYISPCALEKIYCHTDEILYEKYPANTNSGYYRSICNYCEAAQGDNFVINEYNSPFYPVDTNDLKKIKFFKIDQEIQVCAGSNSVGYVSNIQNYISVANVWKK